MVIKTHKKKKSTNWRGKNTHGHGARKKWKKSGHQGGVGMAGTGKRADHKKSLVIKLYGNDYFGKQGITSKSTKRKTNNVINLETIEKNLDSLLKKYGKGKELILKKYKILGDGELNIAINIKASAFSESAKEKIEKAGGSAIILKTIKKEKEIKEHVKAKPKNITKTKAKKE